MTARTAIVAGVAVAALSSCASSGAAPNGPAVATVPTAPMEDRVDAAGSGVERAGDVEVTPTGFERVQATVTTVDGKVCELCLWLADDDGRRARGLMAVGDLGAGDGMAFVYPDPRTGSFWMKNTLLPLSIAFFGPDGAYLDAFDMEPCVADPCPTYPTPRDFLIAVETVQGGLGGLGMLPGSTIDLTDLPCP